MSERAGTAPVLYLGQDSDDVSPRVLVQTAFYEPWDGDVSYVAYDALQPRGCIGDDPSGNWDRSVIGFAEFPQISRCPGVKTPSSSSRLLRRKPSTFTGSQRDEIGVLGTPPLENVESGGESA